MLIRALVLWVGWNMFLAVIPVALGYYIHDLVAAPTVRRLNTSRKLWVSVVGLAWLFFLPNTCYLLTEWRHFLDTLGYSNMAWRWHSDSSALVELMMHTLFYLCYSSFGMLTFALAIRPVARLLRNSGANMTLWAIPLFLLSSIGVYLGLVLRFNTWDMVTRPRIIWSAVVAISDRPMLTSLIIVFAGFLWVGYLVMDIWVDGFVARWGRIRGNG